MAEQKAFKKLLDAFCELAIGKPRRTLRPEVQEIIHERILHAHYQRGETTAAAIAVYYPDLGMEGVQRILDRSNGNAAAAPQEQQDEEQFHLHLQRIKSVGYDPAAERAERAANALKHHDIKEVLGKSPSLLTMFYHDIKKFPLLDTERFSKLFKQWEKSGRTDTTVRNLLISHNVRLVIWIAKKSARPTFPFLDCIQEGSVGLIKALEKFDPQKGFRFSTYAKWWIQQAISRALENRSRLIRWPVHVSTTFGQIKKAIRELTRWSDVRPTTEEIAQVLGVPIAKVREVLKAHREQPLSDGMRFPDQEEDVARGKAGFLQFFQPKGGDQDPVCTAALDNVFRRHQREHIELLVAGFTPPERFIAEHRTFAKTFGNQWMTLKAIGEHLGVTRERIRQIEAGIVVITIRRANALKKGRCDWVDTKTQPSALPASARKDIRRFIEEHSSSNLDDD